MTGFQIPRNSLAFLLAAQFAVIAPHVLRLPFWVTGVVLACGVWRVMVYQGRWSYPGRWVKAGLVLAGFVGIPLGYSTFYGVEPAVALLIVAFALKLLEMHHKRDAYIVILLGYFVCITEFLFYQTIPVALYMSFCVLLVTAALIGLNQTVSHRSPIKTLKTGGLLLMQSLPLMVVLFVLFPRISPLWTVPLPTERAVSGVGEVMSPGDIAELTQSDELAFKATFEGSPPPYSQLYWRGLVLTEFDGRSWTQNRSLLGRSLWRHRQKTPDWVSQIEYSGDAYTYDVILEPTQQSWMFALPVPALPEDRAIVMLNDYRLAAFRGKIRTRMRYQLTSYPRAMTDRVLDPFWAYRFKRLPASGNERARELALQMRDAAGSDNAYIRDVLRMYNLQAFVYTLKPPTLGEDSIDEFLFDSRRGFCEHYAGSFVFLMRAAGIPARVVVGYHGGEYNPNGNYVSVRQFDAHAWTEVWLPENGWVRMDPTQAVAPERVERGLEAAVEEEASFLEGSPLSIFRYRQLLWLTELRLQMDAIGHYWDTWVVGYNSDNQMSILKKYLGDVDKAKIGMIMLGSFFGLLSMIGLILVARRSRIVVRAADADYLRFCHYLSKQGLPRLIGEGPYDYAARVSKARPDLEKEVDAITAHYVALAYREESKTADLKAAVRRLWFRSLTAS